MSKKNRPQLTEKRIDELSYYFAEYVIDNSLVDNENLEDNDILSVLDESYDNFIIYIEGAELITDVEKKILIENEDDLDTYIKEEAIENVRDLLKEEED